MHREQAALSEERLARGQMEAGARERERAEAAVKVGMHACVCASPTWSAQVASRLQLVTR